MWSGQADGAAPRHLPPRAIHHDSRPYARPDREAAARFSFLAVDPGHWLIAAR